MKASTTNLGSQPEVEERTLWLQHEEHGYGGGWVCTATPKFWGEWPMNDSYFDMDRSKALNGFLFFNVLAERVLGRWVNFYRKNAGYLDVGGVRPRLDDDHHDTFDGQPFPQP